MNIKICRSEESLTLILNGRLDVVGAPILQKALEQSLPGAKQLVLDLKEVDYLSSAGVRIVLIAQKRMAGEGGLVLANVNEGVMNVFRMTGLAGVLQFVSRTA